MHVKARFAPSPTGNLHLGSARTALFNYLFSKKYGGDFVLRMEDTDIKRSDSGYEESIINDLRWLGIFFTEKADAGGSNEIYRQSQRVARHKSRIHELFEGGFLYRCFCGARDDTGSDGGGSSCKCRTVTDEESDLRAESGEIYAYRFKVPQDRTIVLNDMVFGEVVFPAGSIEDFAISRSDGNPTFHLSVVCDDIDMGITHVIRGEDHLPNTPKHILLFEALGSSPPIYCHHSLMRAPGGAKMSKRTGGFGIANLREEGYLPDAVCNYLALMSWSPPLDRGEIFKLSELVEEFDLNKISKSPVVFDSDKLLWINSQHIALMSIDELEYNVKAFYSSLSQGKAFLSDPRLKMKLRAVKTEMCKLSDVEELFEIFNENTARNLQTILETVGISKYKAVLERLFSELEKADFDYLSESEVISAIPGKISLCLKGEGYGKKDVFMSIRFALTGELHGPELSLLMPAFGIKECKRRVSESLSEIGEF